MNVSYLQEYVQLLQLLAHNPGKDYRSRSVTRLCFDVVQLQAPIYCNLLFTEEEVLSFASRTDGLSVCKLFRSFAFHGPAPLIRQIRCLRVRVALVPGVRVLSLLRLLLVLILSRHPYGYGMVPARRRRVKPGPFLSLPCVSRSIDIHIAFYTFRSPRNRWYFGIYWF